MSDTKSPKRPERTSRPQAGRPAANTDDGIAPFVAIGVAGLFGLFIIIASVWMIVAKLLTPDEEAPAQAPATFAAPPTPQCEPAPDTAVSEVNNALADKTQYVYNAVAKDDPSSDGAVYVAATIRYNDGRVAELSSLYHLDSRGHLTVVRGSDGARSNAPPSNSDGGVHAGVAAALDVDDCIRHG